MFSSLVASQIGQGSSDDSLLEAFGQHRGGRQKTLYVFDSSVLLSAICHGSAIVQVYLSAVFTVFYLVGYRSYFATDPFRARHRLYLQLLTIVPRADLEASLVRQLCHLTRCQPANEDEGRKEVNDTSGSSRTFAHAAFLTRTGAAARSWSKSRHPTISLPKWRVYL